MERGTRDCSRLVSFWAARPSTGPLQGPQQGGAHLHTAGVATMQDICHTCNKQRFHSSITPSVTLDLVGPTNLTLLYFCSLRQRQILKHRMWHLHNVQVLMYPTTPCPPLHDQVSVCGVYPGRGAACEACAGQCTAPAWPHQGGWWPGGAGVVCPALPPRSSFRSLDSRWLVR